MPRVGPYEQTGPMPQVGRYEGTGSQYERSGQIDRPGLYAQPPQEQPHGGQAPAYRPAGGQAAYGPSSGSVPPAPLWPGPAQYGQPGSPTMPRQQDQTGPYERPHDDWSGPMQRIGPTAAAPRYAAGNYNDWSGPLERIDPAAPPSQYGLPSPYATDEQHGWNGQYERPRAEPRYERTGEIDRSGQNPSGRYGQAQYGQAQYGQAQYGQAQYGQAQYGQAQDSQARTPSPSTGRRPGSPRTERPRSTARLDTPGRRMARKGSPGSRCRASVTSPACTSGLIRPSTSRPSTRRPTTRRPSTSRASTSRAQHQETQYQQAG